MKWKVIQCQAFQDEFRNFPEGLQDEILVHQELLTLHGPLVGRPTVDTLKGSTLSNLKELRLTWQRHPYRFLFVFDPKRQAIILVGGNKAGDKQFYVRMIPVAEQRYAQFLREQGA